MIVVFQNPSGNPDTVDFRVFHFRCWSNGTTQPDHLGGRTELFYSQANRVRTVVARCNSREPYVKRYGILTALHRYVQSHYPGLGISGYVSPTSESKILTILLSPEDECPDDSHWWLGAKSAVPLISVDEWEEWRKVTEGLDRGQRTQAMQGFIKTAEDGKPELSLDAMLARARSEPAESGAD